MSNLKMRVAISLTSVIAIIATAGLAVAKPVKKMAKESIATEKSTPAEVMPNKIMAAPENEPVSSSQTEPATSTPPPDVAVETKIPLPTMDTNGDGRPDAWDRDSNGVADAWDTNNDDKPDALDNDGDGKPDMKKKESAAAIPEAQPR